MTAPPPHFLRHRRKEMTEETITTLKNENEDLKKEIEALKNKIKELKYENKVLEDEIIIADLRLDDMQAVLRTLKSKLQKARE
jgi:chromosome segregation ATPase